MVMTTAATQMLMTMSVVANGHMSLSYSDSSFSFRLFMVSPYRPGLARSHAMASTHPRQQNPPAIAMAVLMRPSS
jgi:hypothetical protein